MTEYQKKMHENMWTKTVEGKWYSIDQTREDYEEFMEAVKHFIQTWGCAEFNEDFTRFRRTEPINVLEHMDYRPRLMPVSSDKRRDGIIFPKTGIDSTSTSQAFYQSKMEFK